MDYLLIGKLVNTHALKGEVRIISDFSFKSRVFVPDMNLYIGKSKEEVTILTYRPHKNFDMCKFKGYDSINDVVKFKNSLVYINRDDLKLNEDEYLDSDLINLEAFYKSSCIGKVLDIVNNNGYKLFLVNDKYIPYNKEFIELIDISNGKIIFKNLEGLL